MWSLLQKRLLLISGKGGVGKSTYAAALARAARLLGRRVLVAEVDTQPVQPALLGLTHWTESPPPPPPAHSLLHGHGPGHGHDPAPGEPLEVEDGLATLNIDHTSGVVFYLREHLPVPRVLRAVVGNPIIASFLRAAPSITEMAVLNRVLRLVRDSEAGELPYDLVIVDLPALGHAFQMLKVAGLLAELVRIGPAAQRSREVDELLRDRERTALVLVSLAEEMPVSETIQFGERFATDIGLPVQQLLVNQVTPALLGGRPDGERLRRLAERVATLGSRVGADALLQAAMLREQRASRAAEQVERLRLGLPGVPLLTLPVLVDGEGSSAGLVRELAGRLAAVDDARAAGAVGGAVR